MTYFVRTNPNTPCQPEDVHHPHRWECTNPDCDNWGVRCGYSPLLCCVCNQDWPCEDRKRRDDEKKVNR